MSLANYPILTLKLQASPFYHPLLPLEHRRAHHLFGLDNLTRLSQLLTNNLLGERVFEQASRANEY